MKVRMASEKDIERIHELLSQVALVHHKGRPDLFKYGQRKYTDEQLREILKDESRPIFAAVDEDDRLQGYAFCIFQQHLNDNILTDIKTLYIDDLCVDENRRGHAHREDDLRSCPGLCPGARVLQRDAERVELQ